MTSSNAGYFVCGSTGPLLKHFLLLCSHHQFPLIHPSQHLHHFTCAQGSLQLSAPATAEALLSTRLTTFLADLQPLLFAFLIDYYVTHFPKTKNCLSYPSYLVGSTYLLQMSQENVCHPGHLQKLQLTCGTCCLLPV